METALAESTALSSKSEREYITLRDSLKGMKGAWRADVDSIREDMRKREERWRGEAETTGKKYAKLVEESKGRKSDLRSVEQLREEDARTRREVEEEFREEIRALRDRVQSSSAASEKAEKTAEYASTSISPHHRAVLTFTLRYANYAISSSRRHLAGELARLRRLMRSTPDQPAPESSPT
jgi:chromosome segregation ATPase